MFLCKTLARCWEYIVRLEFYLEALEVDRNTYQNETATEGFARRGTWLSM